jgi:ABC-type multidrug transport system fused ATPase/permease subunit
MIQFFGLSMLAGAVYIVRILMTTRAGQNFHLRAIQTLITAPLSLFTQTPPGVLLNRFSQDLNILDSELGTNFSNMCFNVQISIGMAAVVATASPYVAISYPFLGGLLYALQRFYLKTSRQLRFLDLETKSPLL